MQLKSKLFVIAVFISVLFLQGCTISQNVVPVDANKEIEKIYVQKNDKVLMEGFHPELLKQLNELGFATETYSGDLPKSVTHYMNYTANWKWDMAMFLVYFKATLYEQGNQAGFSKELGQIEYDATKGGGNMSKFGNTADKIRPLLKKLLDKVKRKSVKNNEITNNSSVLKSSFAATENKTSENKPSAPMTLTTKPVEKNQPSITENIAAEKNLIVVPKNTAKKPAMLSDQIKAIQTALQSKGYYVGNVINGELNKETKAAISLYKEDNGLAGDSIDNALLKSLRIAR